MIFLSTFSTSKINNHHSTIINPSLAMRAGLSVTADFPPRLTRYSRLRRARLVLDSVDWIDRVDWTDGGRCWKKRGDCPRVIQLRTAK
jgi:hypothetical protein